jgi:spore coat protein U-like protein
MKAYYSRAVILMLCACLLVAGRPLLAAGVITCEINAQSLDFGVYDLINALDSSSNITVTCTRSGNGTAQADYLITLSVGSGSYSAREMSNGVGGILYYNLYRDPARAVVWGGISPRGLLAR